jgi:hypothetical protein
MPTLLGQRGADGLRAAIQHPRFVCAATAQQQLVQCIKVDDARYRNQMVARK